MKHTASTRGGGEPTKPCTWREVLQAHRDVVSRMDDAGEVLDRMVARLVERLREGGCVYLIGNGGSAADAQHIAAELTGRFKRSRRALAAAALTTDTSALTAIGNDLGFERVFSRQVEALAGPGDVVWALSTSGNSPNVLEALRAARRVGATTIGFGGESGGAMAELCDLLLCVPHTESDRIQEGHILAYHYVCERLEQSLSS